MAAINYREQGSLWLFMNINLFNKFIFFTFVLSTCFKLVSAQENIKSRDLFLEAESYFLYEEYSEALPIYIKLKDQFPNNFNIDFKIGRCYIYLPYEKQRAPDYLERASKHISLAYKEGNYKEINTPIDVLFYLGDAYRVNNQLEKAIKSYQSFKAQSNNKVYDLNLVDDQIKACHRGIEIEKTPIDISESNLGEVINTPFSETNPVVSENETMLVYASKLPFYEAVYYSKKELGKWTKPINMIPELGVDGDCYPTSISADGTELYIYRSNEFKGDIFVTNFKNGKWSKIRKLNNNINTKYWESHACVSHDGKTLYFTSNRKGGFGGLDIYKSTRSSADNWGPAVNLGSVINSPYNEETPFLLSNGKRLYFSSFGHETMGGYDVFYSDQNSDNSWSTPVNLGYPINTSDDDVFYNPIRDGSIAYIAKFDKGGFGKYDIYRYEIFSDQNPRKYLVNGSVRIPSSDISKNAVMKIQPSQLISEVSENKIIAQNKTNNRDSLYQKSNKAVFSDSLNNKGDTVKISKTKLLLNSPFQSDTSKLISPNDKGKSSISALSFVLFSGLIGVVFFVLFIIIKRKRNDTQKRT